MPYRVPKFTQLTELPKQQQSTISVPEPVSDSANVDAALKEQVAKRRAQLKRLAHERFEATCKYSAEIDRLDEATRTVLTEIAELNKFRRRRWARRDAEKKRKRDEPPE